MRLLGTLKRKGHDVPDGRNGELMVSMARKIIDMKVATISYGTTRKPGSSLIS